ncbi:MAG: hypothetical protein LLF99_10225 [Desulfobacteraceae bacterium]|nr:hypothetical protein [Desulfobacteraceae bacterium]
MRKKAIAVGLMLIALCFGVEVSAQQVETKTVNKKKSIEKQRVVTAKGTVEAINLEKRVVTLKGAKGKVFDVIVSEKAKNLPQLKVGDKVTVKYSEAMAVRMMKPGESGPIFERAGGVAAAKPGEKPGGVAGSTTSVTAKVEAIDKKQPSVTLKGPEGKTVTIAVENPKNLNKIKVGDQLEITYTEALAVSVTAAKTKKK